MCFTQKHVQSSRVSFHFPPRSASSAALVDDFTEKKEMLGLKSSRTTFELSVPKNTGKSFTFH